VLYIVTAQRRFDLMAFLTPDQIKETEEKLGTLPPMYNKMLLKLPSTRFQQEKAAEYFRHGFVRRMGTLVRCVDNVFALIHCMMLRSIFSHFSRTCMAASFPPIIPHSITETTAHFAFHVQMVVDFMTVDEMGNKMLDELGLTRP
jgi:hypothetical protein